MVNEVLMDSRKKVDERESVEGNFLEARYANYFEIGHNSVEFVLGFGQSYESDQGSKIHTRIVTSPVYAKEFFDTLKKSVGEFSESITTVDGQQLQDDHGLENKTQGAKDVRQKRTAGG